MRYWHAGMGLVLLAMLSACSNTGLRQLQKPGDGPDEFIIVPSKPLQAPTDYTSLPTPTPGGSNITDQQPLQDATAALGGRRALDASGPIPARDSALVNQASRFGRDASIRATLAAEDEDFRKRRGRFTQIRISRVDRYNQVYQRESLNARAEWNRWRRAGAQVPSSPPAE